MTVTLANWWGRWGWFVSLPLGGGRDCGLVGHGSCLELGLLESFHTAIPASLGRRCLLNANNTNPYLKLILRRGGEENGDEVDTGNPKEIEHRRNENNYDSHVVQ